MTLKNQKTIAGHLRDIVVITVLLSLTGCGNNNDADSTPAPIIELDNATLDPAATAATNIAWQQGTDILRQCDNQARQLRDAIRQFLDNPNADTLNQSREHWRQAHQTVLTFSIYFALADTNPGMFGELIAHRYNLDAHPIQPGFIDYFDVYRASGIVNDLAITLSAEALRDQHGITDDSDISIGFHAMEYLLWGENGQRPLDDFVAADTVTAEQSQLGLRVVDLPSNRRRVYLQLLAELLVDDCDRLATSWREPNGSMPTNYQLLSTQARLQLWQTTIQNVFGQIQFELMTAATDSNGETENADSDDIDAAANTLAEPIGIAEDNIVHNPFAGNEASVIAAQLRGVARLLYGDIAAEQQPPQNFLAAWINTATSASTEATDEETEPPPVLALQAEFNRVITALAAQNDWPLAEPEAQAVLDVLIALREAIQPRAATEPAASAEQAEQESIPSQ